MADNLKVISPAAYNSKLFPGSSTPNQRTLAVQAALDLIHSACAGNSSNLDVQMSRLSDYADKIEAAVSKNL